MEFFEIIFWNNLVKPPVARKLAVRHTNLVCLTASFLATGGFTELFQNACIVYKHAYLNTLLLLHSSCLYSAWWRNEDATKTAQVGGHALNSHGNYIVDHGKSWKNHGIVFLNFCGNPDYKTRTRHKTSAPNGTATNPAPSSHTPVGLNFQFPNIESKI